MLLIVYKILCQLRFDYKICVLYSTQKSHPAIGLKIKLIKDKNVTNIFFFVKKGTSIAHYAGSDCFFCGNLNFIVQCIHCVSNIYIHIQIPLDCLYRCVRNTRFEAAEKVFNFALSILD